MLPAIIFALLVLTLLFGWHGLLAGLGLTAAGAAGYQIAALLIALCLAIPAGIVSAVRRNTLIDYVSTVVALLGQSMPTFWLGIMLILLFSVQLNLFPSSGRGEWRHLVLPAVTLGLFTTARITRLTRSGMLEVLGQDYIRTARAKGLSERRVIMRHGVRSAITPIVTVL